MEIQDEDVKTLVSLDLTSREARVYLALAMTGRAKIKQISKVSKVPRQDTYRIIFRLQKLGLVERAFTVPASYEAIPVKEGLSFLLQRRRKALNKTQFKVEKLFRRFRENNSGKVFTEDEPQFTLISGHERIRSVSGRDLCNAQRSVELSGTWELFGQYIFEFGSQLQKIADKNLRLRAVITEPKTGEGLLEIMHFLGKNSSCKFRYCRNSVPIALIIIDKKTVDMFTEKLAELYSSNLSMIRSSNKVFVEIARNYFETVWNEATACTIEKLTE